MIKEKKMTPEMAKHMNRHFKQNEIQMITESLKRYSTYLLLKGLQTLVVKRSHFLLIKLEFKRGTMFVDIKVSKMDYLLYHLWIIKWHTGVR